MCVLFALIGQLSNVSFLISSFVTKYCIWIWYNGSRGSNNSNNFNPNQGLHIPSPWCLKKVENWKKSKSAKNSDGEEKFGLCGCLIWDFFILWWPILVIEKNPANIACCPERFISVMLWVIFELVSIICYKYCGFQRLGSGLDLSGTDDEDSDSLETPHSRRYGRPVIASRRRSPSARSTSSRISTSAKYDYNEDTDSGIRYSHSFDFFFHIVYW